MESDVSVVPRFDLFVTIGFARDLLMLSVAGVRYGTTWYINVRTAFLHTLRGRHITNYMRLQHAKNRRLRPQIGHGMQRRLIVPTAPAIAFSTTPSRGDNGCRSSMDEDSAAVSGGSSCTPNQLRVRPARSCLLLDLVPWRGHSRAETIGAPAPLCDIGAPGVVRSSGGSRRTPVVEGGGPDQGATDGLRNPDEHPATARRWRGKPQLQCTREFSAWYFSCFGARPERGRKRRRRQRYWHGRHPPPLWARARDCAAPCCFLLAVGDHKILLDCGWDDAFDPAALAPLAEVAPSIDAVLLSHGDMAHLGALPYARANLGLTAPIYATLPVRRMGQMCMYDAHASACAFQSPLLRFDDSEGGFSLDAVDDAFDAVRKLKFAQIVKLQPSSAAGSGQASGGGAAAAAAQSSSSSSSSSN